MVDGRAAVPPSPASAEKSRLGERLLAAAVITPEQLQTALQVHQRDGARLGAALTNLGFTTETEIVVALSEQAGLPFVDLSTAALDPRVARLLPKELERERGLLPLEARDEAVVVACADVPSPELLEQVERALGRPLAPVLVTISAFEAALDQLYQDEYLEQATGELLKRSPRDSAKWVLSPAQRRFLLAVVTAVGLGLVLAPSSTLTTFAVSAVLLYMGVGAYRFYLAYRALTDPRDSRTSVGDVTALEDRDLPIYSILVPVYREAAVLPTLVHAIERLDYPKTKLDVLILLEQDDQETIEVARRSNLPTYFRLVIVPAGQPRGKPRACNYGLIQARGEYVVIYDAEDIPEPSQLKQAIAAFREGGPRLACVQAKLNYFNRDQNLLTRWFTTEYSMQFDLFLPGMAAGDVPIPLGGTSNHFPTRVLRALGAWDPYNVTEDADLGVRLYKAGWKTRVMDSTTYEEANCEVYNWIRQRSRWVKGYIQTYLVHMRHPLHLWRALGPVAFLSFQLVVGGMFLALLLNPLLWALTPAYFLTRSSFIEALFPGPIYYLGLLALFFGNFAFLYLTMLGSLQREYHGLVKFAVLSPLYWILMSIAAWKGFLQLFYAPSYWEKTKHGLYKGAEGRLPWVSPVPPARVGVPSQSSRGDESWVA